MFGVIAVGDTPDASTTFQFSVGSAIYDASKEQLWTVSGQDTSNLSDTIQSYGVALTPFIPVDGAANITLTTYPYLTSQAVVTTTNEQGNFVQPGAPVVNPLLGQAFSAVSFVGTSMTLVCQNSPDLVYLLQSVTFNDDQLGKTSFEGNSVINQLQLQNGNSAQAIAGSGLGVLFIAQAQGTFGTNPSSIAFASVGTASATVNNQTNSYSLMVQQAQQAISVDTSVLTANGMQLETLGSSIVMYPSLQQALQMYVGCDVTAAIQSNSQAVGLFIAIAQLQSGDTPAAVTFTSVIPDGVARAGYVTPISCPSGGRVAVTNATATTTSTGLSYLIAASYDASLVQSVYALPMVSMATNSSNNGMIADFDSIQQTFKIEGINYRLQGFNQVITNAAQINCAGTADVVARLQVGAGPVPLAAGQYIEQLVAQGDVVYITIQHPFATGCQPGMFASQALFDAQGRIMSWSPWHRVAGTDDQMLFAIKNRASDATMYVSGAASNTIQQTVWNATLDLGSFVTAIAAELPSDNGGVQGLFAISNQTPNCTHLSLMLATGNQSVCIAQSGTVNQYEFLQIDTPQTIVTIDSQLGLAIGSVVAATFADNGNENWLFLGGTNGCAVLSNDTTGIGFTGQLTDVSSLVGAQISCKTLGNFSYVKKLVCDQNFLYILTLDGVYRIALAANKFTLNDPAPLGVQVVFQVSGLNYGASCLDMVVDQNLVICGTTAGLYSIDVSDGLPATATAVIIPGGLHAVTKLMTIGSTPNFYQNFYTSSNLYVLSINYALQQACLNRFTITNGQIEPIQDQLLAGQNGPLLIFDTMVNNIFIDGSLGFATSYRMGVTPGIIKYMEYVLQAGRSSAQILLRGSTANLAINQVVSSLGITGLVRDYASGSLVLSANFGILTDA